MDHIFTVLPGVLRKRGLQDHAEGALVVLRARNWIEGRLPHLAGVVRVSKFKDNTVHIECTHSIAVQECRGMMEDLHAYLRAECSFAGIVRIQIGRS